ncbi:hypothetical protein KSP39_PZI009085 [Platanthera zijinensis]|uniref:Uncharacterized protein n=1 Tax=Platanthera zijinensis TaxID=2320716 RepID=A0AAP0BNU8_9ASPA
MQGVLSRYTIRAGCYLYDKKFRYLKTIRVSADAKLITLLLPTFQHQAGVKLYTSCYHLAESYIFNKHLLPFS